MYFDIAKNIMRYGRTLSRLSVMLCNGEIDQEQYDKKIRNPRRKVLENAKVIGVKGAVFGGDPRGCVVKLKLPSKTTNDFGQEGWCVPGA